MKLLIDGIVFQSSTVDLAEFWEDLISNLAGLPDIEIDVLDRGGFPKHLPVKRVPFPQHNNSCQNAADSEMIQRVVDTIGANVFCSTAHTTPLRIPSVAVLTNFDFEQSGRPYSDRAWQEKRAWIAHAELCLSFSPDTTAVFRALYPEFHAKSVYTLPAIWPAVKRPRAAGSQPVAPAKVRGGDGLDGPCLVLAGGAGDTGDIGHLWPTLCAIAKAELADVSVVTLKPMSIGDRDLVVRSGVRVLEMHLAPKDRMAHLQRATGVMCLPMPGSTPFFLMRVVNAGVPVLTFDRADLRAMVGTAGVFISDGGHAAIADGLRKILHGGTRQILTKRAQQRALEPKLNVTVETISGILFRLSREKGTQAFQNFADKWTEFRRKQAFVDPSV